MTDEQFEDWCASLIIVGGQAFLPEEAHVAEYERRKSRDQSARDRGKRNAYMHDYRQRQRQASA
jgi:hypothetical protein